jgi:hypothetical protein
VCLDGAKNNLRIKKLSIINKNSEKIVFFSVSMRIVKSNVILNGRNIVWIVCWE